MLARYLGGVRTEFPGWGFGSPTCQKMPAVGGFAEWVVATLARSASTPGAGGDTDLKIASLTASPVRSGRVALICFGGPGLAEATSWLQGERVSHAARRRYSHILLGS